MGKTKTGAADKIVSDKDVKKAKDVVSKLEARQAEVLKNKPAPKESSLLSASKKIKKEPIVAKTDKKEKQSKKQKKAKQPKVLPADKEPVKAEIATLDVNKFGEFIKTSSIKYNRIRRRTIEVLKIDKYQVKKAVQALQTFYKANQNTNQLFGQEDDFIYLEIILSQVPEKYSIRPLQIALPVPIYGPEFQTRACIISTDPERAFKDKVEDLKIPCVAEVIGYTDLVKNYPQYNDKRKLFYDFDLFFCDYRIYNLMKKPTGKIFYERKKIPYPIDGDDVPEHLKETHKTYEDYLNDLTSYTYFSMGNGPVYTLKVARASMGLKDVVKNVIHGVYNVVPHILKDAIKHTKIRQISIKTAESISLPIFNQLSPEEIEAVLQSGNNQSNAKAERIDEEEDDEVDEE